MRRKIIDYFGTRSSDRTSSPSPKRTHIRDNNQSTTTVLDSIRDKIYMSQEELLIHEMTTSRLLRTRPKRTPIKGVITQEDEDLSITIVHDKEGSSVHKTIKNLDYYDTRTTMTQENRLPQYLKKQIKTANDKGKPADRPSTQKKVLYIRMTKVLQWTPVHTKAKGILQTTVQDSGAGSKPLITLSAMGFISATYSENCSSEQPTATPSPIGDKFAEGRKDLTNLKA